MSLLRALAVLIAALVVRQSHGVPTLIFSEEFNTLNYSLWKPMITMWRGGLNQFQWYSNSSNNSYVKNGMLHINPTLTADVYGQQFLYNGTLDLRTKGCNYDEGLTSSCYRVGGKSPGTDIINPIMSARLSTNRTFSFTYGTVEIRAKVSRGDYLWPSFFLMPVDYVYGSWPASGETDIFEFRGNDNFTCSGNQRGNSMAKFTLHWGLNVNGDKYPKTEWWAKPNNYSRDFHVYRMSWTKTGMTFSIDNQTVANFTAPTGGFWKLGNYSTAANGPNIWANGTNPLMAPFDQKFYLILKVSAGGDFFVNDACVNYDSTGKVVPKPWNSNTTNPMRSFWEARSSWLPTWSRNPGDSIMMIDYIRIWSL